MSNDHFHTVAIKKNIQGKQLDMIEKASNGVWYYREYFLMSIIEDRLAGKLMSKRGYRK